MHQNVPRPVSDPLLCVRPIGGRWSRMGACFGGGSTFGCPCGLSHSVGHSFVVAKPVVPGHLDV